MSEISEIKKKKLEKMKKNAGMAEPIIVTDSGFSEFVKKYPLVAIDCWAAWCGPCRMMAPVIDELAHEFSGKAVFGKLDVDSNPMTAAAYGIMSIPTILFFRNGEHVDTAIGFGGKEMLKKKIEVLVG